MDCFQTVKTIKRWNHLSRKMVSLWKGWTAFCRGQSRDFPLPQQGRGHFKALSSKSGLQRAPEALEKGSFARFLLPSPGQDLEKQEGKKKKKIQVGCSPLRLRMKSSSIIFLSGLMLGLYMSVLRRMIAKAKMKMVSGLWNCWTTSGLHMQYLWLQQEGCTYLT